MLFLISIFFLRLGRGKVSDRGTFRRSPGFPIACAEPAERSPVLDTWDTTPARRPNARRLPGPQKRGTTCSYMYRKYNYVPNANMVHNDSMRTRTNLHIDNDALAFASSYANAKGVSLGIAVSELIRRAEQTTGQEIPSPRLVMNRHGYLEIADTGDRITPEMVKEASEDALV